MKFITPNLQLLFSGYNFRFQECLSVAPEGWWKQVATEVPSDTDTEIYFWLSKLLKMRKWTDERMAQSIASYEYLLKNEDWEITAELDRNLIKDDRHAFFASNIIPMMASQTRKQPDYMIRDIIRAGESTTIWDGQNYFDVSHPVNKFGGSGITGTQRNYWASGMPLNYDNYVTVRAAMSSLLGEDGEPLGVDPDMLMVAPQLEEQAKLIVGGEFVPVVFGANTAAAPKTNVMRGTAKVLVVRELAADPTAWCLLDTSKPVKPFLFQNREAPTFVSLIAPTDPKVFREKKLTFGVDMRAVAGFGPWQFAAKARA